MPGANVVADGPKHQAPNYPVVWIRLVLLHAFLDLLDGLGEFSLLEEGESPMTVAVVGVWVIHLGLPAHLDGLRVKLVHVEYESQIVVSVNVVLIDFSALLQVVYSLVVLFQLEIREAQVVVELRIIRADLLGPEERLNCVFVVAHLVQAYSQVEEALVRAALRVLQVLRCELVQLGPVSDPQKLEALAFEVPLGLLLLVVLFLRAGGVASSRARARPPEDVLGLGASSLLARSFVLLRTSFIVGPLPLALEDVLFLGVEATPANNGIAIILHVAQRGRAEPEFLAKLVMQSLVDRVLALVDRVIVAEQKVETRRV